MERRGSGGVACHVRFEELWKAEINEPGRKVLRRGTPALRGYSQELKVWPSLILSGAGATCRWQHVFEFLNNNKKAASFPPGWIEGSRIVGLISHTSAEHAPSLPALSPRLCGDAGGNPKPRAGTWQWWDSMTERSFPTARSHVEVQIKPGVPRLLALQGS